MSSATKHGVGEAARPAPKGAKVVHIGERRVSAVLARYPKEAVVIYLCRDCNTERREMVGDLIRDHQYGGLTPDELALQLKCQRMGCGGDVDVGIRRDD